MNRLVLAIAALAGTLQSGWVSAQSVSIAPGVDSSAGPTTYNVREMDFDLWCQQTQRYDADRCTARRLEDVKAFEDYRTAVERYELDHLKQLQKDETFRAQTTRDPLQNVQGKQDGLP